MKAKQVMALMMAAVMAAAAPAAVFASDSSVAAVESVAEAVEAEAPVVDEEVTADNIADFISLGEYKGLNIHLGEDETVAQGDTVVINFTGKVHADVAAALAAEASQYEDTVSVPESLAELIEEVPEGDLIEEAQDETLIEILESEAEEMTDSIAEAVAEGEDWVEFDGGSAEEYTLKIGSGDFIEGFEEQLIGAKIGDDVEIRVTFPENYYSTLAGEDALFETTITDAYHMEEADVLQYVSGLSEVLQYPKPMVDALSAEYMDTLRYYYDYYTQYYNYGEDTESSSDSAAEAVEDEVTDEEVFAALGMDEESFRSIILNEAKYELVAQAVTADAGLVYEEMVESFLALYGYGSIDEVLAEGVTQAQIDRAVYNQAAQTVILSLQAGAAEAE